MDWQNIKDFMVAALIRAIKTFFQTLSALAGTEMVGFIDLDWGRMFSVAGVAFVISIFTSIGTGLPEVDWKPFRGATD